MAKVKYTKAQRARIRRRRLRQIRGAIFLVFAVIGLISVVSFVIGKVRTVSNDDDQKLEFAKLIAPMVSLDPVPFESIEKAKPELLEEASIWGVIYNEDTSKYARNETDQLLIPTVDVDRYFKKMFGSGTLPEHATFSDGTLTFEYSEETDSYVIPIVSFSGAYSPRIQDISSSGSTKILTVEYIRYPDPTSILVPGEDTEAEVYKKMEYVLLKEGNEYHIYSVRYAVES